MVDIVQAKTEAQLDDARSLMRAFVTWHRERHVEDTELIDRYFDAGEFEQELAGLPAKYAPPTGSLLIAYDAGQPAGCVALRGLGRQICEMKRMFVPEAFRGSGIGRALAARILAEARSAGYQRMRLDTSKRQNEAIRLYESIGFKRIAPYYSVTDDLKNWLIFLEMDL